MVAMSDDFVQQKLVIGSCPSYSRRARITCKYVLRHYAGMRALGYLSYSRKRLTDAHATDGPRSSALRAGQPHLRARLL